MLENRKDTRYKAHPARALIEGISGGEVLLWDISISGCCVECSVVPEIKMDTQYKIDIVPEAEAHIGDFEIMAKSIWIHKGDSSGKIGFFILESPKGKTFQRYVDYLAWRSSVNADGQET